MVSKVCTRCKVDKDLGEFRTKKRGLYGRYSQCRTCEKELAKIYCSSPEHLQRRRDAYCPTKEEKAAAAARARAWYAANKDRVNAKAKAARDLDPTPNRERVKAWAKANPDKARDLQKKWIFEHKDIVRKRYKECSNRLLQKDWPAILEMFGHRCAYCLQPSDKPLTVDHIIPLSRGGEHSIENVVPACKSCNSRKYNNPLWEMLNGQNHL